jgi:hypothetical protein
MAKEALRLMKISLTKMVESLAQCGGVSLHKHLLVVTVLNKAYHVVQSQQGGASGSGYTTSTTATTL